ncbi:MAG: DNA primase [Winogradskyella sp.]
MPYISKNTIDKIKEDVSLLQIIKEYVDLQKSGSTWKGLSPFVKEQTPSFMVSESKGIWKCFASGKGGNNAIQFLMALPNGLTYPEAIQKVAELSNITIEYEDTKQAEAYVQQQKQKDELRPLLISTINQYHKNFLALPEDHPAKLEVFGKRQYTMQKVEAYQIGYAPDSKQIYDICIQIGRKKDAMDIGIINTQNDYFRNRVIYPIIERKGKELRPLGLAGRDLTGSKNAPKWLNSKQSLLYNKDKVWYGLDKAQEAIVKHNRAFLVEGYNDVIAFQCYGLLNTIAGCGTAIATGQIQLLKRYCETVVFCMDNDAAGKRSMLKYVQEFLKEGFRTEVLILPDGDPDDFVRLHKMSVEKHGLQEFQTNKDLVEDGFKYLLANEIEGKTEVEKATNAKSICGLIAQIEDSALITIYSDWLSKESGVNKTDIKGWIKEASKPTKDDKPTLTINSDGYYTLPKVVDKDVSELRPVIEKYQMFMANNQIWMQQGSEPPFTFKSVSNFSIDIIQHMNDEKFPMKLVRIKNIHNQEKVFDTKSEDLNTPQAFDNACTAHGNYLWKGDRQEHQRLRAFLFDRMGTGRKVDILGWQPEGFWVWNNHVTIPGQLDVDINDNGVFTKDKVSYYVPSANTIYRSNAFKYEAQKKVKVIQPNFTFQNYVSQVIKVHRNHGMVGILFTIASMFQDLVVKELGNFPMLFLYGPASSGKDQLADVCQSFFGHPQTAINLEGGVSTIKAQVREFAQFGNMISHLSEYKTGDAKLDGVLKGLWDRRGYKRGNIDSHVGTESIPILSSVIMTGNYIPDAEALITRLVWEEMNKTVFNDEEVKAYEVLSDMTKQGISGFTVSILNEREEVETSFTRVYRTVKATLSERMPEAQSRMISNAAVLASFYQIFNDVLQFPFSLNDVMEHIKEGIDAQTRKLTSASIVNRWWDCFLASMRGTMADQLRVGRDFKIEGNLIYIRYTACFNKIQRQWYSQYRDTAPGKTVMLDALKKDESFYQTFDKVRMSSGRGSSPTSGIAMTLDTIVVSDDLKDASEFQLNENSTFDPNNKPATEEGDNANGVQDDLPF